MYTAETGAPVYLREGKRERELSGHAQGAIMCSPPTHPPTQIYVLS